MALTAAQLMVKVGADTSGAESGLGRVSGLLGGGLVAGATAAVAAVATVGIASVKMAGDFQQGITTLVTGAGESQKNIKLVSNGILNLATDTGTSTKQLIDGMFMIESAGFHGAQGLAVLKAAAEGAKTGNADLGTVADATTTILTDYAKSGINANQAVNALIATVSSGKTHMQDLAGAMAQILPTAAAAHIGLSDVMGAMATMTGEGVPAANAATYLRQTILALISPSKQTEKALASVGLSTKDVATAMQTSMPDALKMITDAVGKKFPEGSAQYVAALKQIAGGSKQMQGLLDLTGDHMKTFSANMLDVGQKVHFGKTAIDGWALTQQNFNFKMDKAKEVVETFMIKLGTGLLPIAGKLVDLFSANFVPVITKLATEFGQNLGPVITQVAGFATSTLIPAIMQFATFVQKNVVPIVNTMIGVFKKDVLPTVENVAKTFLTKLLPPVERIASKILPVLNPLLQIAGGIFKNVVGPAISGVITVLGGLLNGVDWVMGKIGDFLGLLSHVKDFLSGALKNALNGVPGFFKSAFGGLWNIVKQPINLIITGINTLINGLDTIHFQVPGWVPGVGGKGFGISIPDIPLLASGGQITQPGYVVVGDAGPELLHLPAGAQVAPLTHPTPLPAGLNAVNGGARATLNGQPMIVQLYVDGRKLAEANLKYQPQVIRNATGARSF